MCSVKNHKPGTQLVNVLVDKVLFWLPIQVRPMQAEEYVTLRRNETSAFCVYRILVCRML